MGKTDKIRVNTQFCKIEDVDKKTSILFNKFSISIWII